jgi:hypothetical protein
VAFGSVYGIRECLWHSEVFVAFGSVGAPTLGTTDHPGPVKLPQLIFHSLMGMRAWLMTAGHAHKCHNKQATIVCGTLFVKTCAILDWGDLLGPYKHVQFLRSNGFSLFKINWCMSVDEAHSKQAEALKLLMEGSTKLIKEWEATILENDTTRAENIKKFNAAIAKATTIKGQLETTKDDVADISTSLVDLKTLYQEFETDFPLVSLEALLSSP